MVVSLQSAELVQRPSQLCRARRATRSYLGHGRGARCAESKSHLRSRFLYGLHDIEGEASCHHEGSLEDSRR